MKKFIIPALVLTIPGVVQNVIQYFNPDLLIKNVTLGLLISLVNMIVILIIFLFYVKRYKTLYCNNNLVFADAFKYSLKVSLAWALIGALLGVVNSNINKEAVTKSTEYQFAKQKEQMIERNGSVSASGIKGYETGAKLAKNPFILFGTLVFGGMFLGLVFSLIASAIFKTKPVET